MGYQTILVHVDDSPSAYARIGVAIALANSGGGHLIGMAPTGVARTLLPSLPPGQSDPTLSLHLGFLREQAQQALAAFTQRCEAAAVASHEARVIDDDAGGGLCLHGRVADVIVLSQSDPDQGGPGLLADLPAYVVLHSGKPVLMVPFTGERVSVGQRVLVSWDASREAACALQLALPLLRQAVAVDLAVFDTGPASHTAADARAADPRPWLARHGVHANFAVHALAHKRQQVGEALLALAARKNADLLVMGAYGHSRVRETILGGVTRTLFESMSVPVLMAH
ncbi:universal stress protein [Massilia pseudoviolaceinigra]|uniref:universal stress protein n=1 Tax=Massilia pseudoviolaceinigra TaxID=3057165 RepID=UPI002796D01D|nr:universal stress protein [Massilia sp. CCM 9206]MDQ1921032.1 universal stress protein [Massilia sp. CCM 9206]